MQILCASSNKNKLKEIQNILGPIGFEVLGLSDIGFNEEIIEDGHTFADNALIKVRALREVYSGIIIADDSGLCVRALDNAPGVYSARYLGEDTPYTIKNQAIIDALIDKKDRHAEFICAMAIDYQGTEHVVEAVCEGEIAKKIQGEGGFGYDPIFIPKGYNLSFGLLGQKMKDQISHRAKALTLLKQYLSEVI